MYGDVSADEFLREHAYIPEHIPAYFVPISGMKYELNVPYVYYYDGGVLTLVAYPLRGGFDESSLIKLLLRVAAKKNPFFAFIESPFPLSYFPHPYDIVEKDWFFRLKLDKIKLSKKIRNAVRRASKELTVDISRKITKPHKRLISSFLKRKNVESLKITLKRLDKYVNKSTTAYLISAYNKAGELSGFNVVELWSRNYAFFLFNIIARDSEYVPGTSDLLMIKMIELAKENAKKFINMGLGINPGVRKFKEKWGAVRFLPYFLLRTEMRDRKEEYTDLLRMLRY